MKDSQQAVAYLGSGLSANVPNTVCEICGGEGTEDDK